VEISETERWQNDKVERTTAKKFVVKFWNFAKNKNFRQTAAARSRPEWRHR